MVIELERSTDCHDAVWHTRHEQAKYDRYESDFKTSLEALVPGMNDSYVYSVNPGPKAHGMHCKQSPYNKKLWHSMVKNDKTQRWYPDVTFCYPRVGSFEICAVKGKQRVPIFSKLALRKWPQGEWLAQKVDEIVKEKMGGWSPATPVVKQQRQYATKKMTDDELRALMKKKFSTLIGAFRAFDKNGDGCISKTEFFKGLRQNGVDLPPAQLEQLWRMADEDGTGNLQYQEFARKFASYKATHSLHRHADYKDDGKQELVQSLHGVDAASRVQKHAAIRNTQNIVWGSEGEDLAANEEEALAKLNAGDLTVAALSRDMSRMSKNIEDMTPDEIRARLYKKHGNILNAFRHFDFDGSSSVSFEEFLRHLPTCLGEPISQNKMTELWRAFDPDMSGEIDMNEFSNPKCNAGIHLATAQGIATFKGQAIDPTMQFAHVNDSKAMVVEKTYGVHGANSQIQSDKMNSTNVNKLAATTATDVSTTASKSAAPSPVESEGMQQVAA